MMLRLITSLNWVVGVVALAAAVAYPFYWEVTVSAAKQEAFQTVQEIARAERARGRLAFFGAGQAEAMQRELKLSRPIAGGKFTYETYADAKNVLVIRALTAQGPLNAGTLPPLMFVVKARTAEDLPAENYEIDGEWVKLSGKKVGLLALLGGV